MGYLTALISICALLGAAQAQQEQPVQISALAPAPSSFNLSLVLGNLTAREDACSQYSLPRPYNNVSYIQSIIGPYQSVVVGPVNYTYHQFGPFQTDSPNNTLVLLPAARDTSNVWTPDLLQLLASDRQVVTVDLPGAGSTTSQSSDQPTLDGIAQSLLGFFQALNLDQPDILGYDWGGTIAMQLGAFYGDSIGTLVLVSTTSGGSGYTPGEFITSNMSVSVSDLNTLLFPNSNLGENGLCKLNAFEAIVPGPGNLTSSEIANQTQVVNSAWANNTLTENLGNITNPTLLVAGELDVLIDFESTVFLLENINSSVLLSTDTAGHGLLFQDSGDVGTVIAQYLDYVDYEEFLEEIVEG